MPLDDYLIGTVFFVVVVGAVAGGTSLLLRRRLGHLRGAARGVAAAVIFLAGLLLAQLLPGVLGALSRWTVAVTAVLILLGAARLRQTRVDRGEPERERPSSGWLSWALAGAGVAAPAISLVGAHWEGLVRPSESVDTLTFHLPNIASWIQGGSLWQVDQFVPVWALGNYPQNGDLAFMAAVMPWRNDAFAKAVNFPLLALLALAVYAIASELRAPRPTAVLFAALIPSVPIAGLLAVRTTMPDVFLAATFAAGVLFLMRAWRTRRGSDLVLAGVALGLCFGSKWNGVWAAGIPLAVWLAGELARARRLRPPLRSAALVVGPLVALGGFWLVRNWVMSGNPVIPVRVSFLGTTLFGAPPDEIRECSGASIAHYIGNGHIWSTYFWPGWRGALGAPALAALGGAVLAGAAAIAALRRRPTAERLEATTVLAALVAVCLLVAAYVVTPYSALGPPGRPVAMGLQARYLVPALAVAAAVGAWGVGRLGRLRLLAELIVLVAILVGVRNAYDVPGGTLAKVVLGLTAVAAAAWLVIRVTPGLGPRRNLIRAGAIAALGVLVIAIGYERQQAFNERRYTQDPALRLLAQRAPGGQRVALAGRWNVTGVPPVLPAFGPTLRNEVSYPARSQQRVLRPFSRREQWAAAVRRGHYDLMLVGNEPPVRSGCHIPGDRTDWNRWARAEGYSLLARSSRFSLYRVAAG